jgi:DNA-binding beta-propeller fold protein YncE
MPDGAISRDRSKLYWTESVNGATRTVVHVTELASGHDLLTFTVDGDLRSPLFTGSLYQLTGEMISADNRHLVLSNTPYKNEKGWVTRLAVVDVISGVVTVSTEIVAPSTYGVLGLSPDGRSVFVDQFGDGAITTRVFDVASRGLADVSRAGLSANGFRTGGVFTPDGRWMFRVDSAGAATGGPVVVALDLVEKRAVAIPLSAQQKSSGSEWGELWSVALTVDGSTLYAVNPAMGVVNEIDVRQLAVRRSSPIPVSRRGDGVLATIQQLLLPVVDAKRFMIGGAALSPDGRTLYAAGNSGISAIDTATLTSRQTIWRAGYLFDLLALSPDGRRLYAVDNSTRNVIGFDARDGVFLGTISFASMVPAIVRIDSTH